MFVQVFYRPELEASPEKKPQRSWLEFGHRIFVKTHAKILGLVAKTLCISISLYLVGAHSPHDLCVLAALIFSFKCAHSQTCASKGSDSSS